MNQTGIVGSPTRAHKLVTHYLFGVKDVPEPALLGLVAGVKISLNKSPCAG